MKLSGHSIPDLAQMLRDTQGGINCSGLLGAERAYFLYRLYGELDRPLVVVCSKAKDMEDLSEDIRFFCGKDQPPIITFSSHDIIPFKPLSYDSETSCRRIEALYRIMTVTRAPIVITTGSALLQKLIPKERLSRFSEYVLPGEELDRDDLIRKLIQGGYQETVLVEEPGDYAVRGALVDLFTPLYSDPVRIEFFGDTVESIRTFSPQDQLSLKPLAEVVILPAVETLLEPFEIDQVVERIRSRGQSLEMSGLRLEEVIEKIKKYEQFPGIGGLLPLIYPSVETLFDYLASGTLPVLIEPADIERVTLETEDIVMRNYLSSIDEGHLCVEPEELYLNWSEMAGRVDRTEHLAVKMVPVTEGKGDDCNFSVGKNDTVSQQLKARKDPEALLSPLVDWINHARENALATYLLCGSVKQAKRLEELIIPYGVDLEHLNTFVLQQDGRKACGICIGQLSSGFIWPQEGVAVITYDEIFGPRRRLLKTLRKEATTQGIAFQELKAGDLIVHIEHGIGQYGGLVKLEVTGLRNDFLCIEYKDGDKLYVPVDRMNSVQKYAGVDGITPRLDKMGGKSWARVKERVKKSVRKMAGELLKLYAWRKVQEGHTFSPPDQEFRNFENSFEYTETPDQMRAVQDVMDDMESPVPMDRLICGDVGYGKTEIALRAAFRSVWENKQVAFLVPTTVLAEQHYQTFKKRFESYPIEIERLSRFRSPAQQRSVVQRLKDGRVDIVIGTHRLLQKDIGFKELGLVILDEEQRFGVAHKERLKRFRRTVDVLALTATPIPRTLHMSLLGVRDMSVIATPPEYRYPIKTYVCVMDDMVVAEAIQVELQRGGQIFFVHNHIRTIWAMARRIRSLVPGIRIGVAHGRMGDEELETVMLQFLHHEIDLLVCTSIIESGLDFPSANTILINRADKFGLGQIYQLRGRVGRGDEQAYAYLFIPHENAITRDAQKRLRVLMEHSDLGSGFQIAMSDLQIRGGGTILGPTQSGQVASVGYEMYLQLMERAISELKGEPVEPEMDPEIVVSISAYIPEGYIFNIDQRLTVYRRLAKVTSNSEIEKIREELLDRFGPLPDEAMALLEKIMLKVLCKKLYIQRLELGPKKMALVFSEMTPVTPEKIMRLVASDPEHFSLKADYVLQVGIVSDGRTEAIKTAKKVLQELDS